MDHHRLALASTSTLFLVMQDGFRVTLRELAKFQGNAPGAWLDEIEHVVIDNLKGTSAEGLDVKLEAGALSFALAVVEEFFASFRQELAEGAASR